MTDLTYKSKQIKKGILILIFACLFAIVFLIHTKARLFGDDWYYHTFSRSDFSYYIQKNVEHYKIVNGRAIVHVLTSLFLKLPAIFWWVVNTLFLGSISWIVVSLSSEHSKNNIDKYICGALATAFIISTMGGKLTSQSVYWLTGSFNYVYPLFMIMLLIYKYQNQGKTPNWGLYILGFLAGATVEQAGMMTLGFILLKILHKHFMLKEEIIKKDFILLFVTLAGLLTVVLAPGTFVRSSLETQNSKTLIELIKFNMKLQGSDFLFSKIMIPVHILSAIAAYVAVKLRTKQKNKLKSMEIFIIIYGGIGIVGLVYQLVSPFAYTQYLVLGWKHVLFLSFIGLGYLILLFYSAYVIYSYGTLKHKELPSILLIIGLGSIIMMLISPVFGYRNLIFVIFCLTLYSLMIIQLDMKYDLLILIFSLYYLIQLKTLIGLVLMAIFVFIKLINFYYKPLSKRPFYKEIVIIGLIGVLVGISFYTTYRGFRANANVYDINIEKASNYTGDDEKPLKQIKMPNDIYRGRMPYDTDYYKLYYNLYIGVGENQEIVWKEK